MKASGKQPKGAGAAINLSPSVQRKLSMKTLIPWRKDFEA